MLGHIPGLVSQWISEFWLVISLYPCLWYGKNISVLFILVVHVMMKMFTRIIIWLLFVGRLISQQHASISQGRICSDNCTCCHTEIKVADHTFYLTQPQYTDSRPNSPSTHPWTLGACPASHWSANVRVTAMTWWGKIPMEKVAIEPGSAALMVNSLAARPTGWY